MSKEQKGVLAEMLQDEHIAGIHTTLAYINKMMDLDGLELHQDGESYPNDYNTRTVSQKASDIFLKNTDMRMNWKHAKLKPFSQNLILSSRGSWRSRKFAHIPMGMSACAF